MKKNKGLTLVELIIVLASLGLVTLLVGSVLTSSSKDSYTLTDKVMVQNSVTSLMNVIQKDVQEAKIVTTKILDGKNIAGVLSKEVDETEYLEVPNTYFFNSNSSTKYDKDLDIIEIGQIYYTDDTIKYEFDKDNRTVTRTQGKAGNLEVSKYDNIVDFSMEKVDGEKYGVTVKIVGGTVSVNTGEESRTRYELNSTFYTRNTI